MNAGLAWEKDGLDWPHRSSSRFVDAGGLRWHVQRMSSAGSTAPCAVLLHGTGASTHSWRGLAPLLSPHFDVVAFDLPGHGFTSAARSASMDLPGMGRAVESLLTQLQVNADLLVGHSAGVAIASRMCLDRMVDPRAVVGLNSALLPFDGLQGHLFSPAAKVLAAWDWVPRVFSWQAGNPAALKRLIDGTGSTLDAEGLRLYGKLIRSPGHVTAALSMMANWDLRTLASDLGGMRQPLWLATGGKDTAIPRDHGQRILARVPNASLEIFPDLGHLAHEEAAESIAEWIIQQARTFEILIPTRAPSPASAPHP